MGTRLCIEAVEEGMVRNGTLEIFNTGQGREEAPSSGHVLQLILEAVGLAEADIPELINHSWYKIPLASGSGRRRAWHEPRSN